MAAYPALALMMQVCGPLVEALARLGPGGRPRGAPVRLCHPDDYR